MIDLIDPGIIIFRYLVEIEEITGEIEFTQFLIKSKIMPVDPAGKTTIEV